MKLYIKEIRTQKNVSLSELSRLTGISKSYLSDLENKKRKNISIDKLCKIAKALNVKVTKLFDCKEWIVCKT